MLVSAIHTADVLANLFTCAFVFPCVQLCYPRDQRCELVEWSKAPSKPLHGSPRDSDKIFEDQTMNYAFAIIRVKGSVKWKHNGAGGSRSALKLVRWDNELNERVDILQLGEFEGASDDFATLQFDFEYSSTNSLWGPGEKGFAPCSHPLDVP